MWKQEIQTESFLSTNHVLKYVETEGHVNEFKITLHLLGWAGERRFRYCLPLKTILSLLRTPILWACSFHE